MAATLLLYVGVATVSVGVIGSQALGAAAASDVAPLAVVARQYSVRFSPQILTVGAITAMLGVLLNLVLGLSRVLLAMGRRQDMPAVFARLNPAGTTPVWAVVVVGLGIAALALLGDIKATWSFSAFTVLIYYALTNLAALRLPREQRLAPAWISVMGLAGCLFLAFWVEWRTWLTGLGLVALGLLWHAVARALRRARIGDGPE
jgi:APA family basic amino acid/polyamine antiporter